MIRKIAIGTALFIAFAGLCLPLIMPVLIAIADRAIPYSPVVLAISSGSGFMDTYIAYWEMLLSRPDAARLIVSYVIFLALLTLGTILYSKTVHPSRSNKTADNGDATLIKSKREIKRKNDFWNGRKEPKRAGLVLGLRRNGYIYDSSVTHALTVGKTGSGKTQLMVLQTLHLLMAAGWNIIATGKSELVELTGDKAVSLGYRRMIFDLNGYPCSSRFNPLELVVHYVTNGSRGQAVQTARQVAKDLIPLSGGSNDYFPRAARNLLTAVILIVAMADIPPEQKNMASVCAIINRGTTGTGADPSAPLKAYIRSLGEDHPAYACAAEFLSDGGITIAGKNTNSTLMESLSVFNDESVAKFTETSDISMYDLIENKTIVYVQLLEEDHPYQALFTIFFNQYWRVANEIAASRGGRLPHETAIVGDELGNCNKLDCLHEMVTLGRSMRFHVYAFVQNIGQLRRYNKPGDSDEGMNRLIGSMGIKVALSLAALEDCKFFTELLGKCTVDRHGSSYTRNGSAGTSSSGTSSSETMDDLIHIWEWPKRTPIRNGSIVIIGGENADPVRKENYQMPLKYANKTPAKKFFDLGDEEHEFEVRRAFRKRMEELAGTTPPPVKPWCPDFSIYMPQDTEEKAIAEDELGAWDAVM